MPTTSLFFLPSPPSTNPPGPPPLQTLLTRLTTTYTTTPLPPWGLSHRLFRSTPLPTADPSQPPPLRYLHILTLTHGPSTTYILLTPPQTTPIPPGAATPASTAPPSTAPPEAATVVTLHPRAQTEEFVSLLSSKLSPLWQARHSVQVVHGQGFEVGDFRVRVGEVRQGVGGGWQGRGVVVEVEYVGEEEEEGAEEGEGERVRRAFWEGLGVGGGREVGSGPGEEGWGDVRRWCEVLRLRG